MIPLDSLETMQDDDGFEHIVQTNTIVTSATPDRRNKSSRKKADAVQPAAKSIYMLCFVNMVQVEAYMKSHN